MNKSKIFMIVGISALCLAILGSTLAYYRITLFNETASTITHGLDYYINYDRETNILEHTLRPTDNHINGANSDIEFWKIDDTYDIYGHIYLDINEMSDE